MRNMIGPTLLFSFASALCIGEAGIYSAAYAQGFDEECTIDRPENCGPRQQPPPSPTPPSPTPPTVPAPPGNTPSPPRDPCASIGANDVAVYTGRSFSGQHHVFRGPADYPHAYEASLSFNDNAESVCVGSDVVVEMCVHAEFFGRCHVFSADTPQFSGIAIRPNEVSSLSIRRPGEIRCAPGPFEASAYIHADYLGACVTGRGSGSIDLEQVFGGERASSVRLGPQAVVELVDGGIRQNHVSFAHDVPDLRSLDFNDRAVTMRIARQPQPTPPAPPQECNVDFGQVAIYEHIGFDGLCETLVAGEHRRGSDYDFLVSSVEVGDGTSACLCRFELSVAGRTVRCSFFEETVSDLRGSRVGNDGAGRVLVGASEAACLAREGDDPVSDLPPPTASALEYWNCTFDRDPQFIWMQRSGDATFSLVTALDTAREASNAPCRTDLPGVRVDLPTDVTLVRVIDPVQCGAEVQDPSQSREAYIAQLQASPENDPNELNCLVREDVVLFDEDAEVGRIQVN